MAIWDISFCNHFLGFDVGIIHREKKRKGTKRREWWWKRNQCCMVNDAKLSPNRTLSHYTIYGNSPTPIQALTVPPSHRWPTSPQFSPRSKFLKKSHKLMCDLHFVISLPRLMRGWIGIEPRASLLTGSSNDSPNTAWSDHPASIAISNHCAMLFH